MQVNNTKIFHETVLQCVATAARPRVSHPHAGLDGRASAPLPILRDAAGSGRGGREADGGMIYGIGGEGRLLGVNGSEVSHGAGWMALTQ